MQFLLKYKKVFFTCFTFLFTVFCNAQLGNNWCYNDSTWINFNSNNATSLVGGVATYTNTYSSFNLNICSSISDENGNLLFYTNGFSVWNKQHQIMTNGNNLSYSYGATSLGSDLSTILPFPNNDSLYYVFYVNSVDGWLNGRVQYAIVNIKKQQGLGEVVQQNNFVSNENLGAFTIVKATNTSYWLICKHAQTNKFSSFLISNTGISSQPIISDFSQISLLLTGYTYALIFKPSPDGNHLVAYPIGVIGGARSVYILDFNKLNGQISNPHLLQYPNISGGTVFGMAFSPNSKKVYLSWRATDGTRIYQYNIANINPTSPFIITDTALVVKKDANTPNGTFGDIQLAADNKVYISQFKNYLSCINYPNDTATICGFVDTAIVLTQGQNIRYLPFFYNSIYAPVLKIQFTRQGCNDIAFSFTGPFTGITYKQWSFGDGSFSNDSAIVHQYNATNLPDSVLVTLKVVNVGNTDTLIKRKWIALYKKPIATIGNISYNGCTNASILFNATATPQDTANIVQTSWSLGNGYTTSNTNSFIYNYIDTGNYLVKYWVVDSRGCSDTAYKSIVIDKKIKAGFRLSNPICSNNNFTITGHTSSYNTSITNIKYNFFNGDSVIKIDNTPFNTQPQDTGSFTLLQTIKSNAGCIDSFSANYYVLPVPIINAGGNRILFSGSSILLNAYANNVLPNITYTWQPAIELSNAAILQPICAATSTRVYKLTANTADGCLASDSLEVKVFAKIVIPNVFSPNGDGINDQWDLNFTSAYPTIKVSIYSRNGTRVYYNTGVYTPWKAINLQNNKALPSGTYYYIIDLGNGEKPFSGSVTLLR